MNAYEQAQWSWLQVVGWMMRRKRAMLGGSPFDPVGAASPAASLEELVSQDGQGPDSQHSLENVQKAILAALKDGALNASGLKFGKGTPLPIPRTQWASMQMHPPKREITEHFAGTSRPFAAGALRWESLRFPRQEVLELWPVPES